MNRILCPAQSHHLCRRAKIQDARMLQNQTKVLPLPFRRGEGGGEGLLVGARVQGEGLLVGIRIHREAFIVGFRAWLWALCLFASTLLTCAQTLSDRDLSQIGFDQKLGASISPELVFRNEEGRSVKLGDYFGKKPVILVLGYYQCPMLCSLLLNGMVEGLEDLKWSIGREFNVLNVSINPRENAALAMAKKQSYLKRYGRADAIRGWNFLTGDQTAIHTLAEQVGFRYAYDARSGQYAHASGLVFITPGGKVSGYRFGVTFQPNDLYASLQTAGANQTGSLIRQLVLLCFHYNPLNGKYSGLVMVIVRSVGAATILALLWLILACIRRERGKVPTGALPLSSAPTTGGSP